MSMYNGLEASEKNAVCVAVRFRPLRCVGSALGAACDRCSGSPGTPAPPRRHAATAPATRRQPPPPAPLRHFHSPPLPRRSDKERARGDREVWECSGNAVGILDADVAGMKVKFLYDHVFGPHTDNARVYKAIASPIVLSALDGINGTVFACAPKSQ